MKKTLILNRPATTYFSFAMAYMHEYEQRKKTYGTVQAEAALGYSHDAYVKQHENAPSAYQGNGVPLGRAMLTGDIRPVHVSVRQEDGSWQVMEVGEQVEATILYETRGYYYTIRFYWHGEWITGVVWKTDVSMVLDAEITVTPEWEESERRETSFMALQGLITKLYGLEEVYQKYRDYKSELSSAKALSFSYSNEANMMRHGEASELRDELIAGLQMYGLDLTVFEQYIHDFEQAFMEVGINIALEHLAVQESLLNREERKYRSKSGAKGLEEAQQWANLELESEFHAINAEKGKKRGGTPIERAKTEGVFEQSANLKKKANKKAVGLSETHPLVLNEDFGKVGFAIEDQGKLVDYMLGHIKKRRQNIEDTREHLLETPEMVFGLEVLLQHTYQLSNIQEGGIFDMIIQDRKKSESTQELLKNVGLSALAIAAGLLTFGGGTLAFVGASAAAGVSIYEAREEMIRYNRSSAAHDLGFDLDDPSMLWVVIAVAGAGLDLASVGSTIKGVSRYLKQFSKSAKATDDLSKLKKGLTKLEKTNAKLKNALEQAAEAEARLASVVTGSMRKAYNIHHAFANAVEIAYLFAKKKINGFRAYLLELKRVGLIENIDEIAPGAMKKYKEAFELGQKIEREGLVDSWAVLKKTEIDGLSGKVDNLESLNKALKQDGYDADYFETLLKSKDDPQKFLDDYVSKIGDNGKFADDALETDYANYIKRKQREGKPPRDRADWNQASDYMKYDSPTARGNAFNKKAEFEYDINELNLVLDDGSFVRIDSYVPAELSSTGVGEIISRKATDLVDIKESTFRGHLQEMIDKYSPGTEIRSNAFPKLNGKTIEGKQYLQIPESNKSFYDIEKYKNIAKDEYGIEIIFLAE